MLASTKLTASARLIALLSVPVLMLPLLAGCVSKTSTVTHDAAARSSLPRETGTIDKQAQADVSPDAALDRLMEGNRRFVAGQSLHRDYRAQAQATANGQYPIAVVLSCMDSRSAPEVVFDQGIGDVFVTRVAGNYATADILGSMEYGTKVAGAKLIVVMGHTECGAVKGACDNVQLGNLTTVINAIRPAVEDVKDVGDDRSSHNKKLLLQATQANVRRTLADIRAKSPILAELEKSGQLKIVGAMHDITSGEVTLLK